MGKNNYYCEYCDNKRFKNDASVRKKHISGLAHQMARKEHYARFKSAEEILHEERGKKPCAKFPNGQCQFGASCRFSHFTPIQIAHLQQQAEASKQMKRNPPPKLYTAEMISDFMNKRQESRIRAEQQTINERFKYPEELMKNLDELPPSLRPLDARLLENHKGKLKFFGDT